jgi:hypothetical protein
LRFTVGTSVTENVGNVENRSGNDAPIHGLATPPALIDVKSRAFADETNVTEAERDFVDTVKVNWSSIRTYFR